MDRIAGRAARPKKVMGYIAAALVFAASALQPLTAEAEHTGAGPRGGGPASGVHGGGGFHGGAGLHAGGFPGVMPQGGGFHPQSFHGGAFHNDGFHRGGLRYGFGGPGAGVALGLGTVYAPFAWDYYYPYADSYGYPDYSYSLSPAQYWYYCSDPAGYYPYVTECNTGWQTVPAG